jgi:hypothetical protein
MIAVEIDGGLAVFQRVTKIVDYQRQYRSLISCCPGGKDEEQNQPGSMHCET